MWLRGIFIAGWFVGTVGVALQPFSAHANDFSFFGSGIDYWNDQKKEEKSPPAASAEKKSEEAATPNKKFDWKAHLDPNNKEFFREGEYTPPEPFMELVRNPTDENIKNWFAMIEKKNELSSRMMDRIQEYVAKNSAKLEPQSKAILVNAKESLQKSPPEASRYRFRFYFDSQCPHCKRMFETVADLQSRGFYVEAFQVDNADVALPGMTVAVTKASKADLDKHKITSVPLLLIGDLQKKLVYRLSGYQSTDSVFESINAQTSGG
jgi:thiol-disulfide isomerase/thioredoxin